MFADIELQSFGAFQFETRLTQDKGQQTMPTSLCIA